jgi:hypothetical protein
MPDTDKSNNEIPQADRSETNEAATHATSMTNRSTKKYQHDAAERESLTRRGFLGVGSAALAATGLLAENLAAQQQSKAREKSGYPPADDPSRADPGPTNTGLNAANPDTSAPPKTDAGAVQVFKYPFSFSNKRLHEGVGREK